MVIGVFGCGYVGLTTAVSLANFGYKVMCCDTDVNKIELLNQYKSPIYEKNWILF